MTTENIQKVLIIGGGLAGLTLANALKNYGIPFAVYERDETPEHRKQGYSLALHMCMDYLKKCLPPKRFENFGQETCVNYETNEGGTLFRAFDGKTGQESATIRGEPYKAYRVSRDRFRKWLLKDIQEYVHWNKKMSHYEESDGQVIVHFTDKTQDSGDLLVAADGALSRVTCQLYGGQEEFDKLTQISRVRGYAITQWISEEKWNTLSVTNNQTASIVGSVSSEDRFIAEKTIRMFYTLNKIDRSRPEAPYEVISLVSAYDTDGVLPCPDGSNNQEVLQMVQSWCTSAFFGSYPHQKLINEAPDGTVVMSLIIRERIPQAELLAASSGHVVLIGDSAHPMTMFRGEGANHAIVDAANLAEEIYNVFGNSKPFDKAIRSYYDEMIPRGVAAVEKSHIASQKAHAGIKELVDMYEKIKKDRIVSS